MKLRSSFTALALSLAAVFSAHAQIINVNVNNSGFENPSLPNSGQYIGEGAGTSTPGYPIPDWTVTSNVEGVQNGEGIYGDNGSAPYGYNFGWDDGTANFYQVLSGSGSTIETGTYTLTVALGTRSGGPTAGSSLSLFTASGSSLGTLLKTTGTVGAVTSGTGTFTDYTLTYDVAVGNPYIGDTIAISLAGGNFKSGTGVGNDDFDNVRLTFDPIPEPSTYALMVGGMLMLGYLVRRRVVRAGGR
jgi:hypothetical protein